MLKNQIETIHFHRTGNVAIVHRKRVLIYQDVTASSYRRIMRHCLDNETLSKIQSENIPITFLIDMPVYESKMYHE